MEYSQINVQSSFNFSVRFNLNNSILRFVQIRGMQIPPHDNRWKILFLEYYDMNWGVYVSIIWIRKCMNTEF